MIGRVAPDNSTSFTRNCCSCGLSLDKGLRPFFW